jgi:hypothetical protein
MELAFFNIISFPNHQDGFWLYYEGMKNVREKGEPERKIRPAWLLA